MQLIKIKATSWNGVGFGTSRAVWAVKGHEQWRVWSTGTNWVGHNTSTKAFLQGLTRETLLSKIEAVI
jgi:hypothetical protein